MATKYPILPVDRAKSLQLFNQLASQGLADADMMKMSLKWCEHVDGSEIFPTAPSYLRRHLKKWERSNQVRDKLARIQHQLADMVHTNDRTLDDFLTARHQPPSQHTAADPLAAAARGAFGIGDRRSLAEETPASARRASAAASLTSGVVELDDVAGLSPTAAAAQQIRADRGWPKNTGDRQQRRSRRCRWCVKKKLPGAESCDGRWQKDKCPHRDP